MSDATLEPPSAFDDGSYDAVKTRSALQNHLRNPLVVRLVACLFAGFVMALMIGNQEGSQNDFGVSFAAATRTGRLFLFLGIGLLLFLVLTFWPSIAPYIKLPGAVTLVIAALVVLTGTVLLHWYDPIGKFGKVKDVVAATNSPPFSVGLFFSTFGWVLIFIPLIVGGVAVALRNRAVAVVQIVVGVLAAILVLVAHTQLVNLAQGSSQFAGADHSLGVWFAMFGYLVYALAGVVVLTSHSKVASPMATVERVLDWRPGLPIALIAVVFAIFSFFNAAWFAPTQKNWDFFETHDNFKGAGLPSFASAFLGVGGVIAFVVVAIVAIVACALRLKLLALVGAVLGLLGLIWAFVSLYKITKLGADVAPSYGRRWQNIGAGGWLACFAFTFLLGAGVLAYTGASAKLRRRNGSSDGIAETRGMRSAGGTSVMRNVIFVAAAVALFYPPTLPNQWQSVIVSQIAPYLLLAVGLNVVVGWAGLLDLGYIAFYGIGSYTTAYITGSLPLKPPSWLHHGPFVAIPFAIVACLIAGVILGAPTLRLRGDYLAIVTLGFGEIIQVIAINNPGKLTGGPTGPTVPHPKLHIGPIHITWGLDNLPYWYLLLFILVIVLYLFYRLEGSRIGRAWAAIREDEVAAQATGIRTTRVKLLAFAIGASTSGLAGVFFGSAVGYFDPTNFTLQNSILIVAYVVFGGMGSLAGALAGAAVLTWLPYFLQSQVPLADAQMWIGGIILFMMIFRPAGLIPARRRKAELEGFDQPASSEVSAVPISEGM